MYIKKTETSRYNPAAQKSMYRLYQIKNNNNEKELDMILPE